LDRGVGDWIINEYAAVGEIGNGKRKSKNLEKTCPSVILSTTNSTSSDQGSNPARSGEKMATNRQSEG
jgi:hypothetical protein